MLNISVKNIRIFLWSLLGLAVVFLLWRGVVPLGEITYSTSPGERSDFIGRISPETRIGEDGKIVGEPVYFSLRTPRNFHTAEMEVIYKNKEFPIMEAGLLVDGELWRYETRPLENKILDDLGREWHTLSRDNLLLLQKEDEFSSVNEFLGNVPPVKDLAVYNYDLDKEFVLPDYTPSTSRRALDTDLRGNYQFYTYIKDERLDIDFSFRDINQNKDGDPVDINLYFRDKLIDSKHLPDDGVARDSGEESEVRRVELNSSGLPEGAYKIEVRANNDIITERIETTQRKLSFINKLHLFSELEDEQKIYTTGEELSAKVLDPSYLQTLNIDNGETLRDLDVTETYKRFSISSDVCSPCGLNLKGGDIELSGNGVFAFDKDSLLDPSVTRVRPGFDPEKEDVEYILADYTSPEKRGNHYSATAEFDLSRGYQEDNKYNFMISIPGLKAEDEVEDSVEIKEIRVKLKGRNLWERLVN